MNVLVLGGTVFIGLHLVQLLSRKGHAVTVLNRGVSGAVLPDGVRRLTADRNDASGMRSVLKGSSYDAVFDISCYTPEALEPVIGALDGNVGHFVFCSTTSVYAPTFLAPIREDFPLDRRPDAGDYAKNKVACEDMLAAAVADRGFPATILRPPYVYGPHNKLRQREFSFFARLREGRRIIIPGDGHTLTQPVHVDDLAEAFANVPGRSHALGRIYTVAGPQAITINGYVSTIGEVMGVSSSTLHVDDGSFESMVRRLGVGAEEIYPFEWRVSNLYSIERAVRELDWKPRYEMRDGLAMTYEWWMRQDDREWDFSHEDRAIGMVGEFTGSAGVSPASLHVSERRQATP